VSDSNASPVPSRRSASVDPSKAIAAEFLIAPPNGIMAQQNGNGEQPPVGTEAINTEIVTLTRFLTEEQTKHKEATGDFTYVGMEA
jgi:hypothetical protein